ncbi:hypothetical protein AB0A69_27880 [Streptomyces sp. NPDC045431]|uniref:hypothetical protein n=1 Tax=Streptomyces sp. NPDC045431 TaxID=3155613 RepID=UPI0033FF672A
MSYLVAFDSDEWRVGQDLLVASLAAEWPDAAVRRRELSDGDKYGDVEWELRRGDADLEGRSHVDGRCLYLDGDIGLVADFALWYRKFVPAGIDLVFCDEGYHFDVTIDATTTRDDLVDAAGE